MAQQLIGGKFIADYPDLITGQLKPAVGYKLYTYVSGTVTNQKTYSDAGLTAENTNPVILDTRGEASVFMTPGLAYTFVLKSATGSTIWTRDGITAAVSASDIAATTGAGMIGFSYALTYAAGTIGKWLKDLALSAGSTFIGFIQTGTGAILRTVQDELCETIKAASYGMNTGASAAVNTAALQNAIAQASAVGKAQVEILAGNYALTAGTNFAADDVAIIGKGKVTFDYSAGAGIGFKLDAGGAGALIKRMRVENISIKGGPAITEAFYSRGVVRSIFRNIEVKEATTNGFALRFAVLNTYDHCIISDDTGVMTTRPANYWYLDDDGAVGNHTQANLFLNCEASGQGAGSTKTGWNLTNAILNVWQGGTSESMQIGVDITSDVCRMNSWWGFDMEDNQQYDARLKGFSNNFYSSFAQSAGGGVVDNISISTGVNCCFYGGYYRKVNCGIGSADTGFYGITFDDNAALGIQGPGRFKRYNCVTNTGGVGGSLTGVLRDVLGVNSVTTLSLSQNNTPAQTVDKNEATVTGRMVQMRGRFTANAAGTAASSIAVTLDSSFPAKASAVGLPCGSFMLVTAGGTIYTGAAILNNASTLVFRTDASTGNLGISPAITLANGDILSFVVDYPLE